MGGIPELMALLRFGTTGEGAKERRFGMGRVDVGRLLVTSPAVTRREGDPGARVEVGERLEDAVLDAGFSRES